MTHGWKIYTKTGDKGQTSLLGGTRVPKYHERIEAYGTLDEMNSWIGLIRDQEIDPHTKKILIEIQDRLFTAESLLAAEDETSLSRLPRLYEEDIIQLEKEIDQMNTKLPEIRSFILPGGHPVVSYCHIARCICRRAERRTLKLAEHNKVDELIIKYLNRLSDYLFILARKFNSDFHGVEVTWKARQ